MDNYLQTLAGRHYIVRRHCNYGIPVHVFSLQLRYESPKRGVDVMHTAKVVLTIAAGLAVTLRDKI